MTPADDWVINDGRYALDFDGTDDVVSATLPPTSVVTQFTMSCWAYRKSSTSTNKVGVGIGSSATGFWVLYLFSGTLWEFQGFQVGVANDLVRDTTDRGENVWVHVVGTVRIGNFAIYTNGVLRQQKANPHNQPTQTAFLIGNLTGYNLFWNGLLDDLIIWNRGLTDNEVARLYQLGRGGMLERRRRRRVYTEQAGFRGYYATQRAQLIGGGLR
jgi:hypothetical protein